MKPFEIIMPLSWQGALPNKLWLAKPVVKWLDTNVGPRATNLIDFKHYEQCGWFYGHLLTNIRGYGKVGGWHSIHKGHIFYFRPEDKDKALLFKLTWAGYSHVL